MRKVGKNRGRADVNGYNCRRARARTSDRRPLFRERASDASRVHMCAQCPKYRGEATELELISPLSDLPVVVSICVNNIVNNSRAHTHASYRDVSVASRRASHRRARVSTLLRSSERRLSLLLLYACAYATRPPRFARRCPASLPTSGPADVVGDRKFREAGCPGSRTCFDPGETLFLNAFDEVRIRLSPHRVSLNC